MSCLGEALERYSGIFRGDEPCRAARYSEIAERSNSTRGADLIQRSSICRPGRWNRREGRYNWVSKRFNPEGSIEWSPAWSLTQQRTKYLPTAYCYFGYPFDPAHDFCRPDSNGNAAGSSLDEAIVHGFLELAERECASVWWYNRLRRPGVDIDSFGLPDAVAIRSIHRLIGRSLDVLDITADRNLPTFVAVSRSEEPQGGLCARLRGALRCADRADKSADRDDPVYPVILSGRDPDCFLCTENGQPDMSFLTPDGQSAATICSDFPSPSLANRNRRYCPVSSWRSPGVWRCCC